LKGDNTRGFVFSIAASFDGMEQLPPSNAPVSL